MFRQYVAIPTGIPAETRVNRANKLFRSHPSELAALLEMAWEFINNSGDSSLPLGNPSHRSDIPAFPEYLLRVFQNIFQANSSIRTENRSKRFFWDHLIYAYLIENTRLYEIFRRVLYEYRHGERLGAPSDASVHWLRNTEELFFRDPAPFSIYSIVSSVRPDSGASRRNAYWRMFGMDLNHGLEDGKPYPYHKPEAANREFVTTLESFLTEVWIAIENVSNISGPKLTDDATIANLARRLHDMLMTRRQYGNLSHEEFYAVSMMAWFHLSLEYDSPIVQSLKAEAAGEAERLKKIAERVKLPTNGQAFYFFRLADPLSSLLIQIEQGIFNEESNVSALYTSPVPPSQPDLAADMKSIVTNWSNATGRNLKERSKSISAVR